MHGIKLYIDIDGVLLGKDPASKQYCLANNTEDFLIFALANFDCYWLTTHCKGDANNAVDYLRPYCDEETLSLLKLIKETNYTTFKTEVLSGDFICIDDQPTAYEILYLDEQNWLDRWFEINTRKNLDALIKLKPVLEERIAQQQNHSSSYTNTLHTKHYSEGVKLIERDIDQTLPYLEFYRDDNHCFTLQRGDTAYSLILDIHSDDLDLEGINSLFHSWLNQRKWNNGQDIFDKLFRYPAKELAQEGWRCERVGATGSVEHICNQIKTKNYDEKTLENSPTSKNTTWTEGDVDYTKPFYAFQYSSFEVGYSGIHQHYAWDLQVTDSGELIFQAPAYSNERSDLDADKALSYLNPLPELDTGLSLIERIHLWANLARGYREAYRANNNCFNEPPWNKDQSNPFLEDYSGFRAQVLHPVLFNSDDDAWRVNDTPVDQSLPYFKIEFNDVNSHNTSCLIGLLSVNLDSTISLNLMEDWLRLNDSQQYKVKTWLLYDVFDSFTFEQIEINLLKRCRRTQVTHEPDGSTSETKAEPQLSLSYINELAEAVVDSDSVEVVNGQIMGTPLSDLIITKEAAMLDRLEAH